MVSYSMTCQVLRSLHDFVLDILIHVILDGYKEMMDIATNAPLILPFSFRRLDPGFALFVTTCTVCQVTTHRTSFETNEHT